MKLFFTILVLLTFKTSVYADTSCTLSRSGTQEKFLFEDYYSSQLMIVDMSDPSCRVPMGRTCTKRRVIVKRATLLFPSEIRVTHEVFETPFSYLMPYFSRFIIYKGSDWIQTYTGAYDPRTSSRHIDSYSYPRFFEQFGEVLSGGFTLECRESASK